MTKNPPSTSSLPDSLWAHSASQAPTTRALQGRHDTDIAIIGAGFTGLSAALHLAEAGKGVIVLEANEIGYGGSGRNVGLVNAGLWKNPDDIDAELGKTDGDRLDRALGEAPDLVFSLIERFGIQCEATRNGTLHLAHSKAGLNGLKDRARQLTTRGAPISVLDANATADMTGTQGHFGAILDPRAGTVQPLSYVRGLAAAAQSMGATIHTGSAVTALTRTADGSAWKISTESGEVTASKVILATNAYSGNVWKGLQQSFTPLHFFQLATDPIAPDVLKSILPGQQGCWDTRQVMTSFRKDQSGRLILGSVGEFPDHGSRFLQDWASHQLRKFFPDLYPAMTNGNSHSLWRFGWSGKIAYSNDHLPHLHVLGPGLITCLGYSGRGIGPGTVMGKAIAEHLLGASLSELPLPVTEPSKIIGRDFLKRFYLHGSDIYHLYQRMT